MVLAEFLASPAGLALKGALVAAFLDFAVGSLAAARNGSFAFDAVAAFLRKHVLGRVLPLGVLLMAGYLTGDATMNTFAAAGLVAYATETMASVYASFTESKATATETIPTD
jgi:hypothetical protein